MPFQCAKAIEDCMLHGCMSCMGMAHLLVTPSEGRSPTTPQCAAGPRMELPVSVPKANSAKLAAKAAAPPPLEPVHRLPCA